MAVVRAVLAAAAVIVGLVLLDGAPANMPAHPWRYPGVMHVAGRYEWFTPRRLFIEGWCQQ